MAKAQVEVSHTLLTKTIIMEVDRDFLVRAQSGNNPAAEKAFAIRVRDTYNRQHGKNVHFLPWNGIAIRETAESLLRPQGCGCECPGCDQGHHCRIPIRDCHL